MRLTADLRVTHLIIGAATIIADVLHIAANRRVDALLTAVAAVVKARCVAGGATQVIVGDASVGWVAACPLCYSVTTDVLRLATIRAILFVIVLHADFRALAAVPLEARCLAGAAAEPVLVVQAGLVAKAAGLRSSARLRTAAPPVAVAIGHTGNFVECTLQVASDIARGSAKDGEPAAS